MTFLIIFFFGCMALALAYARTDYPDYRGRCFSFLLSFAHTHIHTHGAHIHTPSHIHIHRERIIYIHVRCVFQSNACRLYILANHEWCVRGSYSVCVFFLMFHSRTGGSFSYKQTQIISLFFLCFFSLDHCCWAFYLYILYVVFALITLT